MSNDYGNAFAHNPSSDETPASVHAAKPLKLDSGVEGAILDALVRLIGGNADDYSLKAVNDLDVTDDSGDAAHLAAYVYDPHGGFIYLAMRNRALDGWLTVYTTRSFEACEGPGPRILAAVASAYRVHRNQVSITVVETYFGSGRVEWSVNQ